MENRIEFLKLEKVGDSFTGNYKGISKGKNNNFMLVFIKKNSYTTTYIDYAVTISENMKHILREANKQKDLVFDAEIKIELLEIIELKTEGHTYKKYKFIFGNGRIYEEKNFNYLDNKDINSYLE